MTQKPAAEDARLAALKRLMVMDSSEDQAYDDITRLAASLCGTPIALISLIDDKRQWFKSRVGLATRETPRDMSFCAHALPTPLEVLVVEDAQADTRFAENPLVTGDPNIRFYAGAPLVTKDNEVLGTLCVIDRVPRVLDPAQLEMLAFMATQVITMLEAKAHSGTTTPAPMSRLASEKLERLRRAIAEQRAPLANDSATLRLLTERMRRYESGQGLAPSVSEFLEWRSLVELEKAKAHFSRVLPS